MNKNDGLGSSLNSLQIAKTLNESKPKSDYSEPKENIRWGRMVTRFANQLFPNYVTDAMVASYREQFIAECEGKDY